MPTWESNPPTDLGRSGFRLVRTPPAHALIGHVLNESPIGCRTHFIGHRTVPCEAPNCDICAGGVGWRWHGYAALVIDATQEIVIFETTAKASAALVDYFERYKTTRGAHLKAQRLNGRSNGRVMIQAKPCDLSKINLPASPDVKACLCHIWNIPTNQVTEDGPQTRPPSSTVRVDRDRPELGVVLPEEPDSFPAYNHHRKLTTGGNGDQ